MTLQLGFKIRAALTYKRTLAVALGLAHVLLIAIAPVIAINSDLPPESLRIPLMAKEDSISTYVPSQSTEGSGPGIAVNVIFCAKARYKDGAPIAVVAPGGVGADGLSFNMHAAQVGAVEVRCAFPGGGTAQFGTKGTFDNRGARSIEAFRDVLLFAGGRKTDYKGRSIEELMAPVIKVNPANLGIVGWDNGANIALVTMAKFGMNTKDTSTQESQPKDVIDFVKWLALYEAPVGSMFSPANLGSASDLLRNRHYREGSAATGNLLIDYRKLKWKERAFRNPNKFSGKKRGLPGIKGVLFFDDNDNDIWEESKEYAFNPALDTELTKQYFPPQVTAACERLKVFGDQWPTNVATVAQSEEYFGERDGSLYIAEITSKFPKLLVSMFASAVDHSQQQLDHPHICFLYNLFLTNKVRWLRLNPDPCYVASISGMSAFNFVNNKPNHPLDPSTLLTQLEPEGTVPDYVCMQAIVAELVDRLKTRNLVYPISQPLAPYNNGAAEAKADAEARHKAAIEAATKAEKLGESEVPVGGDVTPAKAKSPAPTQVKPPAKSAISATKQSPKSGEPANKSGNKRN
ncbi:MAG: hypothetical protein Q8T09_06205 [Candidatus Melainabacteria bacterium]|nr:hypothetical protein [Candidatus Melainabacteria bacterium]